MRVGPDDPKYPQLALTSFNLEAFIRILPSAWKHLSQAIHGAYFPASFSALPKGQMTTFLLRWPLPTLGNTCPHLCWHYHTLPCFTFTPPGRPFHLPVYHQPQTHCLPVSPTTLKLHENRLLFFSVLWHAWHKVSTPTSTEGITEMPAPIPKLQWLHWKKLPSGLNSTSMVSSKDRVNSEDSAV